MKWSDIVENGSVESWGGFNKPSDNGLYGYGTEYGLDGLSHTGVDISAPLESVVYAPFSGTVNCAGTANGTAHDGSLCGSFNDYFGSGAGRVELQSGDDVLIFGHSSKALVKPGEQVSAGDPIATSGGMVSPHIHLEARVPDLGTGSGWRIVDPADMVNGLPVGDRDGNRKGGKISTSKPFVVMAQLSLGVVLVVVGVRSLMTSSVLSVVKGKLSE